MPIRQKAQFGLDIFSNPKIDRDYTIRHSAPEFTSRCPVTGQPDFGTIHVEYVPDKWCVELKSLKFYLQQFREKGIYYEDLTNQLVDDLVRVLRPRRIRVESHWNPRGGMSSLVVAEYVAKPATTSKRRASNGAVKAQGRA